MYSSFITYKYLIETHITWSTCCCVRMMMNKDTVVSLKGNATYTNHNFKPTCLTSCRAPSMLFKHLSHVTGWTRVSQGVLSQRRYQLILWLFWITVWDRSSLFQHVLWIIDRTGILRVRSDQQQSFRWSACLWSTLSFLEKFDSLGEDCF